MTRVSRSLVMYTVSRCLRPMFAVYSLARELSTYEDTLGLFPCSALMDSYAEQRRST